MIARAGTLCGYAAAGVAIAFTVMALAWVIIRPAHAHDAPTGWSYPYACCSGIDCRPVSEAAIIEDARGYTIRATGELIPQADPRIKQSPDVDYHWCSVAGADDSRTICLFVPPRSF